MVNSLFIVLLLVVVVIYIALSQKKEGLKKSTPKEDLAKLLSSFSQTIIYLIIVIFWGLRWVAGIFKEFIRWFKSENKAKHSAKKDV